MPICVFLPTASSTENMVVFVAATKCDILNRKVTEKEGQQWAQAQGFHYFEVRSKATAR